MLAGSSNALHPSSTKDAKAAIEPHMTLFSQSSQLLAMAFCRAMKSREIRLGPYVSVCPEWRLISPFGFSCIVGG